MTKQFFILFLLVSLSCGSLDSDLASIPTFSYVADKWDCSEMSFFAQHELEEMGYNAQVAVCNTYPRHAWVLVVTEKRVIAVEAVGTIDGADLQSLKTLMPAAEQSPSTTQPEAGAVVF